jgi:D-alanyl-D-alanine carboxypeptidase
LLHGGRRRRRGSRLAFALLVIVVPLALAASAYALLSGDSGGAAVTPPPLPADRLAQGGDGSSGTDSVKVGRGTPGPGARETLPPDAGTQMPLSPDPRGGEGDPSPLVDAEPAPQVPLVGADVFTLPLKKPPHAALVFDMDTGKVLWRLRPLKTLPIASLTKIMTALVVTEDARPNEPVRITQAALNYSGSGIGVLPRGKRVRLETLLNGMLIVSGNDAAIALAMHVAGSERRFVRLMNEHALRWGLRCTHFSDVHGLSVGDRSCPRDLAVMARLAMERPRIARIVRRQQASFKFPIKGHKVYFAGHNPLIRGGYRGALGLKTGYTDPAGRCFVGVARRGGRTLAVVLLNSPNPDSQAPKLLDRAFASL